MALQIKKAVKTRVKIRIALAGPAGAGKTLTSLKFASVLAEGGKIGVIDTEHGRASVYANRFDFDVIELDKFSPQMYIEALQAFADAGYAVVIIDSLSHAWAGEGGVLEIVDKASAKSNNKFTSGWSVGTPLHNQLINAIMAAPFHVIATMRAKTEYVMEMVNGKATPRKAGMAPIQRDNMDYEFNFYGVMDRDHSMQIDKTDPDCFEVGQVIGMPDERVAQKILAWLNDGAEPAPKAVTPPPAKPVEDTPSRPTQPTAPARPAMPAPQQRAVSGNATTDANGMATERQMSSIKKLCAAIPRPTPDFDKLTFQDARDLLTKLSAEYNEARQGVANNA